VTWGGGPRGLTDSTIRPNRLTCLRFGAVHGRSRFTRSEWDERPDGVNRAAGSTDVSTVPGARRKRRFLFTEERFDASNLVYSRARCAAQHKCWMRPTWLLCGPGSPNAAAHLHVRGFPVPDESMGTVLVLGSAGPHVATTGSRRRDLRPHGAIWQEDELFRRDRGDHGHPSVAWRMALLLFLLPPFGRGGCPQAQACARLRVTLDPMLPSRVRIAISCGPDLEAGYGTNVRFGLDW